jgi:gliding motility-associated-like protein
MGKFIGIKLPMNLFARNVSLLWILYSAAHAQNPICPSPYVYMDGATMIRAYDPSQPLSSTNPFNTTIPAFGQGLALMPNINGGTLTPTFYTTLNGSYYYWDGTNWTGTGHSTGSVSAVNIGGCGSYIFNLVGTTGQIYRYDGTGNGTLLTTLNNFSGGGPFDLTTDCNCNFFAITTSTTNGQSLTKYNSLGVQTASWSLVNMPHATSGGGLAIICDMVYVKNNLTNGFFIGSMSASSITFTQVSGFPSTVGDFASCPTCTSPPIPMNAGILPGVISCSNPTAYLTATTAIGPVTYSWSGPGIVGPANGSVIAAVAAGIYTCVIKAPGCPPSISTVTAAVATNTTAVSATLSPSGNICISSAQVNTLHVTHTNPVDVVTWGGPGIVNSGADSIVVVGAGVFNVLITNPLNGCFVQESVNFVITPTVNVAVSTPTMCALATNGSPATSTLTSSGALSYSILPGPNLNASSATGSIVAVTAATGGPTIAVATVIGRNSFCYDTAFANIAVLPNPVINVANGSICPGQTHTFTASGASTYTWAGNGLNSYYGPTVSAAPNVSSSYSIIAGNGVCLSPIKFVSLNIKPLPSITLLPLISTVCLGNTVALTAVGTATSFFWPPSPSPYSVQGNGAIAVVSPSFNQVFSVTGELDGCTSTAQATVYIQTPPVLSLSLSSQAMCYSKYNGSVNSITVTASGATNYSLLSAPGFTVKNAFGSTMLLMPSGPPPLSMTLLTTTLVGQQGVCTVHKPQTFYIIPNPVINISPPSASICPGGAQVFDAFGATTYTWLPSPGYHTYTPSGIIAKPNITSFFSVLGTSNGCHSEVRNAVLLVKPVPTITVFPLSTTVCAGNPVILVATGTSDSYSWIPSWSLSSSTSPTVIATPLATQDYSAIGYLNSCTNQAVTTVSVIEIPSIKAYATQSLICSAAATNLNASGALSFKWYPTHALNAEEGPIVQAAPVANTTYTVWGFNGVCSGSASIEVRIIPRPNLTVSSKDGQNAVCQGAGLNLTAEGAQQYQWSPSEFVLAMSTNSFVYVKPVANTNFTVVGTNSEGNVICPQLVSFSVMVIPKANPNVGGRITICKGERTTLEATGGNTFKWLPSSGLNSDNASRVVASPRETTIYTVDVSYNTYCGNTATVMVTVNDLPTVYAGRDTTYQINDVIMLSASGTGNFVWESGEGVDCRTCATTQVYPSRNTCYVVKVTNEEGCEASDEVCLEIKNDFSVFMPNSFTPNGDGLNDDFRVFGENFEEITLDVFDRWGQMLFSTHDASSGWDGTFKGLACKPDMYVYKLSYKGLDRLMHHQNGHVMLVR